METVFAGALAGGCKLCERGRYIHILESSSIYRDTELKKQDIQTDSLLW